MPDRFETGCRAPQLNVGGMWTNKLRVAVDAALRNVDAATSLDRGGRHRGSGVGRTIVAREDALNTPGGGENKANGRSLAPIGTVITQSDVHEEQNSGRSDEPRRDPMEMLGHADAHRGADPARDCIDPSGAARALFLRNALHEERREGDEGDRVEGDTCRIEDRCGIAAGRIKQKEARSGEAGKGEEERPRGAAANEQPCSRQGRNEMHDAGAPESSGALPGSGFQCRRVLNDEKCRGVQPNECSEPDKCETEGDGFSAQRYDSRRIWAADGRGRHQPANTSRDGEERDLSR